MEKEPPEVIEKRKRNREAAKKCRQKKDETTQRLRQDNAELEENNKTLEKEKKELDKQAREYIKMIREHREKGCKIPVELEEKWITDVNSYTTEDSVDSDSPASSMNSDQDTRSINSRESVSSEMTTDSPKIMTEPPVEAPQSLFSGAPLPNIIGTSRRRNNSRIMSSFSVGPPLYTSLATSTAKDRPAAASNNLPTVSSSSATVVKRNAIKESVIQTEFKERAVLQSLMPTPNVVFTGLTRNSCDATNMGNVSTDINFESGQIIKTTLSSDVSFNNQLDNQSFSRFLNPIPNLADCVTTDAQGNDAGLISLDHMSQHVPGYSFLEDLILGSDNTANSQNDTRDSQLPRSGVNTDLRVLSDGTPVIDVLAITPALLELGSDMSHTLQQQIKSSFGSSLTLVGSVDGRTGGRKTVGNRRELQKQQGETQSHLLNKQLAMSNIRPNAGCSQISQSKTGLTEEKRPSSIQHLEILPGYTNNKLAETSGIQLVDDAPQISSTQLQNVMLKNETDIPHHRFVLDKNNHNQQFPTVSVNRQTPDGMVRQQVLNLVMCTSQQLTRATSNVAFSEQMIPQSAANSSAQPHLLAVQINDLRSAQHVHNKRQTMPSSSQSTVSSGHQSRQSGVANSFFPNVIPQTPSHITYMNTINQPSAGPHVIENTEITLPPSSVDINQTINGGFDAFMLGDADCNANFDNCQG